MINRISDLFTEARAFRAETLEELESFRIRFLGRKGELTSLFDEFKKVPVEQRRVVGQRLNELKQYVQELIRSQKERLEQSVATLTGRDLSLPGMPYELGSRHPVSIVRREIIDILSRLGFTIAEGPEIEDDWHNFSALNFPHDHPARDMQDTFFIQTNPDILLRTHTSPVQVRTMQKQQPPIRTISPGRVFRNEAISARSHCIFHQVEGLYIDENVSFADLKQTLFYFAREMYGKEVNIRLRPSYFPFTEPSAEMDISCNICGGGGCNVCKYTGWLEILGCGMVDPNVLSNCGIDPVKYTGFAFGMGIERPAMLKYQVRDLRLYFANDVRFLSQFRSA
jgi:phenylalanyl-tRNA synthetase alpha chain